MWDKSMAIVRKGCAMAGERARARKARTRGTEEALDEKIKGGAQVSERAQ